MAEAGAMIGSPRRELKYALRESSTTTLLRFKCKWLYADCFFFFFSPNEGGEEREPVLFASPPRSISVTQTNADTQTACEQWFPDVSYRWPVPCQINGDTGKKQKKKRKEKRSRGWRKVLKFTTKPNYVRQVLKRH